MKFDEYDYNLEEELSKRHTLIAIGTTAHYASKRNLCFLKAEEYTIMIRKIQLQPFAIIANIGMAIGYIHSHTFLRNKYWIASPIFLWIRLVYLGYVSWKISASYV